jgi:hypothetical protein
VVEMVRCMLKSKGVPSKYWGEAISTTVYLLNRSPTKSLDEKTPYEAWHGERPRVDHLRTRARKVVRQILQDGVFWDMMLERKDIGWCILSLNSCISVEM